MAKVKGKVRGNESPDGYNHRENTKFEDTISAAQGLIDAKSYEDGYPETFNPNMHINRSSPAVGRGGRRED
jgi:hypothetical protein